MKHVPLKTISIRKHPQLNEKWIQDVIAATPSILGLGDLTLSDKERRQPSGGKLDLLLKDIDAATWYEAELQLGSTDETHIIRTIEYWDIERRRYPQYTHVAVLIAEEVTARFLNVIRLFNGYMPLIALQMTAIEASDGIGLHFTKVVDMLPLGLVEEEEGTLEAVDRSYWEMRGSPKTVKMADEILEMCRKFDPSLALKYNRAYIGFARNGIAYNFASCLPRRSGMNLRLRIPRSDDIDAKIEQAGLNLLEYARWGAYRLKLEAQDIDKHRALLEELLKNAHDAFE
jgi:hypothetical protein